MRLEDIRPHMAITHGFTRFHVADAIAKMLGGLLTKQGASLYSSPVDKAPRNNYG